MPDVLDFKRVLSDQERLQVLVDGRDDHAGPLGEGGTAESVEARLVGVDTNDDQPNSRRSGQDGTDIGDVSVGSGHRAEVSRKGSADSKTSG